MASPWGKKLRSREALRGFHRLAGCLASLVQESPDLVREQGSVTSSQAKDKHLPTHLSPGLY